MKVYTKTGDKGETSLVSGTRVSKSEERIDLYGKVDELNSWIGYLLSTTKNLKEIDQYRLTLFKVQHSLFNLGSLLACEAQKREGFKLPSLDKDLVSFLEKDIDSMSEKLPEIKQFILPGGSIESSIAHLNRTNTRNLERELISFFKKEEREEVEGAVSLLNRLSDFMFVFSRFLNFLQEEKEIFWEA